MRTCNITQTYVEGDEEWLVVLSAEAFLISSTTNKLKVYIPGQLIVVRDVNLPIKFTVHWELICQKK